MAKKAVKKEATKKAVKKEATKKAVKKEATKKVVKKEATKKVVKKEADEMQSHVENAREYNNSPEQLEFLENERAAQLELLKSMQ